MKIDDKVNQPAEIFFGSLLPGTVYWHDGRIYMKCFENHADDPYPPNAVDLVEGELTHFDECDAVVPKQAKLTLDE